MRYAFQLLKSNDCESCIALQHSKKFDNGNCVALQCSKVSDCKSCVTLQCSKIFDCKICVVLQLIEKLYCASCVANHYFQKNLRFLALHFSIFIKKCPPLRKQNTARCLDAFLNYLTDQTMLFWRMDKTILSKLSQSSVSRSVGYLIQTSVDRL